MMAPDQIRMQADPLADATIARMLGACDANPDWHTIGLINRQFEQWQTNGCLAGWQADASVPAHVAEALADFVRSAMALPSWADPARIARAETLFIDYGMLSCTLLFCSSLPECYVIPDLAAVLHVAGQLEERTEYRIRATAAMIFPVMLQGGLTSPGGSGVAQILKVRLIHATIRHLILRGAPEHVCKFEAVPPLANPGRAASMHQALFAHGWDTPNDGMPCNQEELVYTLLTFGYVFLRSMRKLGLGLDAADEAAYLHTWNVMGHVLGIADQFMPDTMEGAEVMFKAIQARGRAQPFLPDPRPELGRDLIRAMEAVIPLAVIRPFPALLTRYLCGKTTATDIGIAGRVNLASRLLFVACMLAIRAIDTVVRLFVPGFAIARLLTRVVGYQFMERLLMDQTRPLKLPPVLLNEVNGMTGQWQVDPKAPRWMNKLEQRLTGRGAGA